MVFAAIVLVAVSAPWIAPQDPYDLAQLDIMDGRAEPGTAGGAGFTYWLGTDDQGRDMLSAIMYGLRISLLVGVGSAVIACAVGASLGMLAAYAGGRTDSAIMRLVDLQLSFPTILAALMILAFLGKGILNVVVALVLVEWAYYARTVRGTALAMLAGSVVIYAFGLPWLSATIGLKGQALLNAGLTPFLLGDALKLGLAALLLPTAWAWAGRR